MLEIKDNKFYLDNEPFNIYSGAMHYFRVLPEYWFDRLSKLKAAGLNTVETYVCWNLHEPKPNHFDFSGILDIKRYVKTAENVGLKVILRPGPYICAEWDLGGLPAWLLKDKNIRLRCNDKQYLEHVDRYMRRLFEELKDCMSANGGNIIAVQVENEYGSYGNDKKYLAHIRDLYLDLGIKEVLFTSDGDAPFMLHGGMIDGVLETVNLGSNAEGRCKALENVQPNKPVMVTEFWCGWFDHWGEKHHVRDYKSVMKEVNKFVEIGASFNFYMFHGGTNFGFTAGANHFGKYAPCTTSYDYYAPLNEYGDYTKLYYEIRKSLLKAQNVSEEEMPLPERPKTQYIGKVDLTSSTSLFDNLENIGEKHYSPMAEGMEYYGQNSGMIYYKTIIKGKYGLSYVNLQEPRDTAYLFVDGKYKTKVSTMDGGIKKLLTQKGCALVNFDKDETELSVLVDCMGHTNYGVHITDTKGLHGINVAQQNIMDYEVTTLPLDNLDKLDFNKNCGKYPIFLKGEFSADNKNECFVKLDGFTKGLVYVNGFNLGRYWNIGPQKTLYLPGQLLCADKPNEIIVMEFEGYKEPTVEITDKHDLG